MSKCVAIITARGGSKRIPRKNIKEFCGFPIIKYSIDAAINAGCFDEIMVSTDDKEIAVVAKKYNAIIPFYRSEKTSNDFATTADVIEEVLLEYKKIGKSFDYACCIYPTAPFINSDKLNKGYKLLNETGADSAIPVVRFGYPIQRALKIENDKLKMFSPENTNVRSQDLTPAYHDAGQFYWINVKKFLDTKLIFSEFCIPIEIPESEVQDIDTEEDWKIAEIKYQIIKNYY